MIGKNIYTYLKKSFWSVREGVPLAVVVHSSVGPAGSYATEDVQVVPRDQARCSSF